jgi:hypothetical protein
MKTKAEKLYNQNLKKTIKILGDKTTYSDELQAYCVSQFKDDFAGVYGDSITKKQMKNKEFAILNSGLHWTAMYQYQPNKYLFYDSFGRSYTNLHPKLKLKNVINTDSDAEQVIEQSDCGARVCAWLLLCESHGFAYAKKI